MLTDTPKIVKVFRTAARDLGFRFSAPYDLRLADGTTRRFLGLVHGFGAKNGTLIDAEASAFPQPDQLSASGYYYSLLTDSYAVYDAKFIRETLDDWGYFGGLTDMPEWFAKRP